MYKYGITHPNMSIYNKKPDFFLLKKFDNYSFENKKKDCQIYGKPCVREKKFFLFTL